MLTMKGEYLPNLLKQTNFQQKQTIWPKPRKTRYITFFCRIHSMADPKKAAKSGILSQKEVCSCVACTPTLNAIGAISLPKTKFCCQKRWIWLHKEVLLFCNTCSVQEDNPSFHYIVEIWDWSRMFCNLWNTSHALTIFCIPIYCDFVIEKDHIQLRWYQACLRIWKLQQ